MENIDLDAARTAVCAWLDEYQVGTLVQMADERKLRYPEYPEEMAVLRGMMAAELRRRTQPETAFPVGGVSPVTGGRDPLRAVEGGPLAPRNSVVRLHRFQANTQTCSSPRR